MLHRGGHGARLSSCVEEESLFGEGPGAFGGFLAVEGLLDVSVLDLARVSAEGLA